MNNKPGGLLFFSKAKLCCSLCRSVANCFQAFAPSLRSGTEIDMTKKNAPTIKDVAREAGVAVGTVSKVINGRNVREPYRQKVEDAIRKLNYEAVSYTHLSKPDWHSDDYWHRAFGTAPTRNVNYSIEEHPEMWERFVSYTHRQIEELGTRYGKIDCLWLDGGWVNPDNQGQDIRLGEIVNKLRSGPQPHLIVCDRTVGGEFENIVTPEKEIPERPMNIPWETCTTVGDRFSFHYTDNFKTGRQLVHLLLNVVSRGGNLALNVAPQPDGALPAGAVASLRDLGRWMRIHGEGIYNTTIAEPYFIRNIRYTAKGDTRYIFYLYEDCAALPLKLHLQFSGKAHKIRLMRTGQEVPFEQNEGELLLDTSAIDRNTAFYADCFVVN